MGTGVNKGYVNTGERYDLNKQILLTDEVRAAYESTRQEVVANSKVTAFSCVMIFIAFNILGIQIKPITIWVILFKVIAIACCIIPVIIKNAKYRKEHTIINDRDIRQMYNEDCVAPLLQQIEPDVIVTSVIKSFPVHGELGAARNEIIVGNPDDIKSTKIKSYLNSVGRLTSNRNLGDWLMDRKVIPTFNKAFEIDLYIDTLHTNKEGFVFANAKATSESEDSDGHSHTVTRFKGPIIVVRMKHTARSDVSLFTSIKGAFGRESSGDYKRIKNTIDTENDEFNKEFEVEAFEDSQAFFVLSPLVMEKLIDMKRYYGKFGLFVHEDYLIFGFNNNKHLLSKPSSKKEAEAMSLNSSITQVMEMLRTVYAFKDAVDLNFSGVNQNMQAISQVSRESIPGLSVKKTVNGTLIFGKTY